MPAHNGGAVRDCLSQSRSSYSIWKVFKGKLRLCCNSKELGLCQRSITAHAAPSFRHYIHYLLRVIMMPAADSDHVCTDVTHVTVTIAAFRLRRTLDGSAVERLLARMHAEAAVQWLIDDKQSSRIVTVTCTTSPILPTVTTAMQQWRRCSPSAPTRPFTLWA